MCGSLRFGRTRVSLEAWCDARRQPKRPGRFQTQAVTPNVEAAGMWRRRHLFYPPVGPDPPAAGSSLSMPAPAAEIPTPAIDAHAYASARGHDSVHRSNMHAGPSTEHQAKRQFQPTIAAYFSPAQEADSDQDSDDDDDNNNNNSSSSSNSNNKYCYFNTTHDDSLRGSRATRLRPYRDTARLAPILPGQVQADLLSVGMRVRKSVPEGYKTHKMSSLSSPAHTALSKPAMAGVEVKPPREPTADGRAHRRELLPFCGLHKIGGYAEQPTTNIHLYGGFDATGSPAANPFPLPAEAFTQPFSSRPSPGSLFTNSSQRQSNSLNPSKRSWQDEDDVSLHSGFFFAISVNGTAANLDDVPVSPLSEAPPQSMNMLPAVRQFAQPKSRRSAQRALHSDADMDLDFENATQVRGRVVAGSGSDFEEADFLGGDVEMEGL